MSVFYVQDKEAQVRALLLQFFAMVRSHEWHTPGPQGGKEIGYTVSGAFRTSCSKSTPN